MEAGMQPGADAPQEDNLAQFLLDVSNNLGKTAEIIGQKDPKAAEALVNLNKQFQAIVNGIGQGEQGGGVAAPETAGAPGAMPAGPQGAMR